MSVYTTKLTNALRKEVFSGNPVPEEWMPYGTWHPGADYICLVLKNSVVPGAFKFMSAGDGLVRAVPVVPVEPLARHDVFKARSDGETVEARLDRPPLFVQRPRELPDESGEKAVAVDRERLKMVCDKLESLLAEDYAEAVDILEANADLLNAAFPKHYCQIDNAIRAFDFGAALAVLKDARAISA